MNKRALSRDGHLVFSLIIIFLVGYVLYNFSEAPFKYLVYIPVCLFGSLFPDFLEPATHIKHRGFFHSHRMLLFLLFMAVPYSLFLAYKKSPSYMFLTAFLIGWCLHLFGDSLTSRLPR